MTTHNLRPLILLSWLAISGMSLSHAQTITPDLNAARKTYPMPSATQINDKLNEMRPAINRAMSTPPAKPPAMPQPVKPQKLPPIPAHGIDILAPTYLRAQTPPKPTLDPEMIAQSVKSISLSSLKKDNTLMLFVSFSIPKQKLRTLLEMAADANAIVEFRGPVDADDMSAIRFVRKLKALKVKRLGSVEINPPLFKRFHVQSVPTTVLAKLPESLNEQQGCSPPGTFVSIVGDVSIEFALNEFVHRGHGDLAAIAQRYLDHLAATDRIGSVLH